MTSQFSTTGIRLMHLLVVSNYDRSLTFYRTVLGATIAREMPGSLAFLDLAGGQLIISVPGGPTLDKPTVTFAPPANPDIVSSELTIRVPDCRAAYAVLRDRGASFLTPPVEYPWEIRAFFRDPDGHLIEISQGGEYAPNQQV
ncbi:MAG: VOC family protein [Herpetosiphon sp.]